VFLIDLLFPKNNASSQFFVKVTIKIRIQYGSIGDVSIGIFTIAVVSNVLLIISTTMEVQFLSINL
jgi:hypothetical protein